MENKSLFEYGTVGFYSHCEVIQIILFDKKKNEYWNYFTHVSFSKDITTASKREWLTDRPKAINKFMQVMISKQIISVTDFIPVLDNAIEKQKWILGNDCAKLDEVFVVKPQFVPETDPTGSIISENTLVPLELSLYGSNFMGNYYVFELFSAKKYLTSILLDKDKKKIQKEIQKAHIQYDLYSLSDRIGNILCKLPVEAITHHPTKLSPERGIAGQFTRSELNKKDVNCYLNIVSINDHMLIENKVIPFVLNDDNPMFEYEIEPNRYKNMITVVDQETGIFYYSAEHDYSFGSDYYATITPPNYLIQSPSDRILIIDGTIQKCKLTGVSGIGEISIQKEIYETELRQKMWKDKQVRESRFFNVFDNGDADKAVETIKSIINDKSLLWDLKEIWIMDPYLSAKDILKTVVYCCKEGVIIKCLTDIGTINGNRETRVEVDQGQDRFVETKEIYAQCLKDALPEDTDIKLEYRTVRGNCGKPFHDRYLILKYEVNKCRAWSLGISVNALGTSHHIIQIVESPSAVADIVDEIWRGTENEECMIYKN